MNIFFHCKFYHVVRVTSSTGSCEKRNSDTDTEGQASVVIRNFVSTSKCDYAA